MRAVCGMRVGCGANVAAGACREACGCGVSGALRCVRVCVWNFTPARPLWLPDAALRCLCRSLGLITLESTVPRVASLVPRRFNILHPNRQAFLLMACAASELNLPVLESPAMASPWNTYLLMVYGSIPLDAYPLDLSQYFHWIYWCGCRSSRPDRPYYSLSDNVVPERSSAMTGYYTHQVAPHHCRPYHQTLVVCQQEAQV